MAEDQEQQIEGLPEGATVRPIQQAQPAATDSSQVEGLPEGATLRSITPPENSTVSKPAAHRAAVAPTTVVKNTPKPVTPQTQPSLLTQLDEQAATPEQALA